MRLPRRVFLTWGNLWYCLKMYVFGSVADLLLSCLFWAVVCNLLMQVQQSPADIVLGTSA